MSEVQKLPGNLKEGPPIKLLIGVPSRGEFKKDNSLDLVFATLQLTQRPLIKQEDVVRQVQWAIQVVTSSVLPGSRQKLVDAALFSEADYLLFLDDDMSFPEYLIHVWLSENRPVIAANCPTRSWPTNPTARNPANTAKGTPVYSDVAPYRWGKVWRVGAGIMMLRRDVLQALPRPAFTPRWEASVDDYVGEDWVMCEHIEAAGFPIIVDHELSQQVGHTGDMKFTWDMVKASRKVAFEHSGLITPGVNGPKSKESLIVAQP